jgi:hypothetical protein
MRRHGVLKKMGMGTRWDSNKQLKGQVFLPNKCVDVTEGAVLAIKLRNSEAELEAAQITIAKMEKRFEKQLDALDFQYHETLAKSEARELQKARRTADQARLEKKGTPVERALAKIANAVLIMEGNVAAKKKKQGEGRYVSKEEARVEEERMMEDMQAMGGKLGETLSLLEDLRDTERKKEAGKSLTKEQQLLRLEQAVLLQKARSNSTGGEPAPHPDCEVCAYRMDSEGNVVTSSLSAEDAALLAWVI